MAGSARIFDRPTFVASDQTLARFVARPILKFIHRQVAGGIVLLVATAAALIWANSPWRDSYHELWANNLEFSLGAFHFEEHLDGFVNDGMMALFFLVVGLEIKRELVTGQLSDRRAAALPAIAAVGGMAVPALMFFVLNVGGEGVDGWGIPMATDIAFTLGVVALLGTRVDPRLKLFLLALAIVDDIGAIAVIAIFYSDDLSFGWLALAVLGLGVMQVMRRLRVWSVAPFLTVGVFVWYATFESGVHATIAGVALGLLAPARPRLSEFDSNAIVAGLPDDPSADEVRHTAILMRESVSVADRLQNLLHPWTSYVVVPIFALANAGIELSGDSLSDAAGAPVTWGVIVGLLVGKPVGILAATWVSARLGFPLPHGVSWGEMVGIGFAAGIGFTVSIFITGLAFPDQPAVADSAKIGILAASFIAAALALVILRATGRHDRDPVEHEAMIAEERPFATTGS